MEELVKEIERVVEMLRTQRGFISFDNAFGKSTIQLRSDEFKTIFSGQTVLSREVGLRTDELSVMVGNINIMCLVDKEGGQVKEVTMISGIFQFYDFFSSLSEGSKERDIVKDVIVAEAVISSATGRVMPRIEDLIQMSKIRLEGYREVSDAFSTN